MSKQEIISGVRESKLHRVHIRYRWLLPLFIVATGVCVYFGIAELGKCFGGLAVESLLHHAVEFASAE